VRVRIQLVSLSLSFPLLRKDPSSLFLEPLEAATWVRAAFSHVYCTCTKNIFLSFPPSLFGRSQFGGRSRASLSTFPPKSVKFFFFCTPHFFPCSVDGVASHGQIASLSRFLSPLSFLLIRCVVLSYVSRNRSPFFFFERVGAYCSLTAAF